MKTTIIECKKCGNKVEKPFKEINRQIKNGREDFFCSISCATTYNKTTHSKKISSCYWCKKDFETTTHKKARKCCSYECAHKVSTSSINSKKISDGVKRFYRIHPEKIRISPLRKSRNEDITYDFVCTICKTQFKLIRKKPLYKNKKTCSKKCYNELCRQNSRNNPNCGGETGYKHYKYKDIWMDSSWEVDIARWMDDNNIEWERSRKKHMFWWTDKSGNKRRYYPDFYLPKQNLYIDTKNKYLQEKDKEKINCVIKENNVKILVGTVKEVINQFSMGS